MRVAILCCAVSLGGCSFIDDFGSFHEPDGGATDGGHVDGGPTDGGGTDGTLPDATTPDGGPACTGGTMDCDHDPSTPCDDVSTSRLHCGGCGSPCSAGQSCLGGMCGMDPVVQLAAGDSFACALHRSGQVQCWGENVYGQLGTGVVSPFEDVPHDVVGLTEPTIEIAAGYQHACARSAAGHVACWGENFAGEIGSGAPIGDGPMPTPVTVVGVANALAIAAGYDSTCAIIGPPATAHVSCWGSNTYGELGADTTDHPSSSMPLDVTLASSAIPTAVGCGGFDEYTCARTTTGLVQCWGGDDHDELGAGRTADPTPAAVMGSDGLLDVRTGRTHVCGRSPAGALECWGLGDQGQLGHAVSDTDPVPTPVTGLTAVISYGVGASHTCAVGTYGGDATPRVYCFGSNGQGEAGIGMGTGATYTSPQLVVTTGVFVEVVAGNQFTCARRNDVTSGAVLCWGDNTSGQTGSGDSSASPARHLSPVAVVGL